MKMSPEPLPGNHAVDFRAPPPSPEAPGRRSSLTNDDVLTEFLHQSLKVPDLILPDRAFPRQKSDTNPPKLDFMKFESLESEQAMKILDLTAQIGYLEVTNHGISPDLIKLVLNSAAGIFGISPEKKKAVAKSTERRYGFEEFQGDEEIIDESEEFLWCGDEGMKLEMEGIWPIGYSNFSEKLEKLSEKIEEIAGKILIFLQQKSGGKMWHENVATMEQELVEKLCHIHKHCLKTGGGRGCDRSENSLRYDVIRMLIKGSEFPHALCLHICSGSTDFHVYSKKGWVSFYPNQDSIVITVGDKLQAWSDGHYKHVIGRPVFKGEDEGYISLSFLFSQPNKSKCDKSMMTISLTQQIIIAVFITIIYQFLVFICNFI